MKKKIKTPSWMQFPRGWRDSSLNDKPFPNISLHEIHLLLTDEQRSDPALKAVWEADITGSPGPIIDYLLSKNTKLSRWGRELIVDWRKRNTGGKPGRKKPLYVKFTSAELASKIAVHLVKHNRNGMSRSEAIKYYANQYGIPESSLIAAIKRG